MGRRSNAGGNTRQERSGGNRFMGASAFETSVNEYVLFGGSGGKSLVGFGGNRQTRRHRVATETHDQFRVHARHGLEQIARVHAGNRACRSLEQAVSLSGERDNRPVAHFEPVAGTTRYPAPKRTCSGNTD